MLSSNFFFPSCQISVCDQQGAHVVGPKHNLFNNVSSAGIDAYHDHQLKKPSIDEKLDNRLLASEGSR